MISKNDLLQLFRKEFATTLRVMKAFPEAEFEFKPHERSQEASRLMSTFVFEMYLMDSYVFGQPVDHNRFKSYKPENLATVIADFEKETAKIMDQLEDLPEEALSKNIEFGGSHFTADKFMLMMLHDEIHHRGQLTVYVRMAGGKVPSIYGPSADDASTNL